MKRLFSKPIFQSIHFKIPVLFGLLFLISFQLVAVLFNRQLESQLKTNFESQIVSQSNFLANSASTIFQITDAQEMKYQSETLLESIVGQNIVNAQLINQNSQVVGVSNPLHQNLLGQLVDNIEVQTVLQTGSTKQMQFISSDTNRSVFRVVTPVLRSDRSVMGAVIIDSDIETVYIQLQDISGLFVNIMVIALVATVSLAIFIASRGIAKPVSEIKRKTELIADGSYDGNDATVYGNDELGTLAQSINELAGRIKEANVAIESERQRLDSVLRHMTDGVIATDRRGNVVLVNEEALQLLDDTRENVLNMSIMDVFKIRHKYTYRQLLETKDELVLTSHIDGAESIVKCEFSVIKRQSGFISGMVCVLSDITEQEKIERERRSFVSNVSHELRTPLTSMRSYTESLIDGAWKDDVLAPKFLTVIQSETNRMIRMVTDLLLLSKMDAGQQTLELEYINIYHLLNNILDRFDMILQSSDNGDKKYTLTRELHAQSSWVEADQDKITQVIDNVLNNAIKYSPDGGNIICRLVESGDNIVISITDEGLGIPRKSIPYVFQRFYRVDKARSREQGGTGLGLAISKDVVELHHGKIWVNSMENEGSTFFISLPKVDLTIEEDWD